MESSHAAINETLDNQLIIFDFDGVIVDSEPICVGLLIEYMARYELPLNYDQAYDLFLGKPIGTAPQEVQRAFGVKIPPLDEKLFLATLFERFKTDLRPIPNIHHAISELQIQKCIASSSSIDRIEKSLEITGLYTLFEGQKFGSGTVKRGKPAPDLFLHAANAHNVAPENCIVVEDSYAGLTAAKSAGMKTIGFTGGSHANQANLEGRLAELSPDIMISSMLDLPSTIRQFL